MKHFLSAFILCLIGGITSCSVESLNEPSVPKEDLSSYEISSPSPKGYDDFFVTESMLKKYLRIVNKGRIVDLIEPVVENGEVLAYYVRFSDNSGWNLIAADTRATPVLSEASKGQLELDAGGPVNGILGTLKNVVDVKNNPESNIQAIWKFLCPEKYKVKTKSRQKEMRGNIVGMWMPVDTVFAYDTIFSGRTIATKWGQGKPWDTYTPIDSMDSELRHSAVGCTAVASGQILYRYLCLTNGLFYIPDSVNIQTGTPQFISFTSDWSGFALDSLNLDSNSRKKTAKFLSWLGYNMDADYHYNSTPIGIPEAKDFMSDYLHFNSCHSYDYYIAHSNVLSHIPVLINGWTSDHSSGHAFIIDACKQIKYQAVVSYIFDPDHEVTDDEFFYYPDWMFQWPGPIFGYDPITGNAEQSVAIDIVDNTYFLMNWGWDGDYDDATYMARSKNYYYNEDFTELYYSTDNIANVCWYVGDTGYTVVNDMVYGFRRID
ncbi:MAG: C10 family peptidase [Bacteroidales bacterium]|nr:C10 family peptidase [Bacteroidales bacterium]